MAAIALVASTAAMALVLSGPPAGAALAPTACDGTATVTSARRAELRGAFFAYVFAEGWIGPSGAGWGVNLPLGDSLVSSAVKQQMHRNFQLGACLLGYADVVTQSGTTNKYTATVDADDPVPLLTQAMLDADPARTSVLRGFVAAVVDGEGLPGGLVYDEMYLYHHNFYGRTVADNERVAKSYWAQLLRALSSPLTLTSTYTYVVYDDHGDGVIESPNGFGVDEARYPKGVDLVLTGLVSDQRRLLCSLPVLRWDRAPGKLLSSGSTWDGTMALPTGCAA